MINLLILQQVRLNFKFDFMLAKRIPFLFFLLFFPLFQADAASLDITEDAVWGENQIIDGRVTIGSEATLIVESGVQIEFKRGGNLRVYGRLEVEGEEDSPVIFFREKHISEEPAWMYYFLFGAGSDSVIKNAVVKEAGGYSESGSWMPGMKIQGDLEIYDSLITQNYWPLQVRNAGTLKIRNSDIYANHTTYGVEVVGNSAAADIVNNYWGDDSGPFHLSANNSGKGEKIKGINLEFVPWTERGKKPIILIPGFGESLNLGKFFKEQEGSWWLFPFGKSTAALKNVFKNSGYEEDKNLFVSFYDWRQPFFQSAAGYLKPIINLAKEKSGFKEVDLVAFSFGGLVARGYIQGEDFGFDVGNLITLGTPHQGVSKIYTLAEGGRIPDGWSPLLYAYLWYKQLQAGQSVLDYIQDHLPSVYEIMPTYDFLENSGSLVDHQTMFFSNSALIGLNNGIEKLKNRSEAFFIGGRGHLTLDKIPIRPHTPADGEFWQDGVPDPREPVSDNLEGDTTVLAKSSTWEMEGIRNLLIEARHGDLPWESRAEIENFLKIELETSSQNFELEKDYLIFCFASPLTLEIKNSEGSKISRELNEIQNSYFYEDDPLGEKMVLIADPDIEYSVKIDGLAESNYRILAILKEENRSIISAEVTGEIGLGENINYGVNITRSGNEGLEPKVEIYKKISSDYKAIAGEVVTFYEENFLKSWSARQEILEGVIAGYNFSKRGQTEEEKSAVEALKGKIRELEAENFIDSAKAKLLLEALGDFS